jgi:hypothetical protein
MPEGGPRINPKIGEDLDPLQIMSTMNRTVHSEGERGKKKKKIS